eukprot:TRINITY_DN3363_c0_g1_i1.p1 TRINITY_DN3363_c0_g1~~TRINITY_DN3363_c0_g1_i1.p1  ORF type:complete len:250 (+),score=20.36 TRINITY_DN3363_c0_g1_i1:114-752(+)
MSTNTTIRTFDDYSSVEWILLILSFGVIIVYHVIFAVQSVLTPKATSLGSNIVMRRKWVKKLLKDPASPILGVQSLRNVIMTSTFFASAASALSVFLIGYTPESYEGNPVRFIQFIIMAVLAFCAFLMFAMSSRLSSHMTFLYSVREEDGKGSDKVRKMLLRMVDGSTVHFSLGFRFLFLMIPVAMWTFGVVPFFAVTIAVVAYLFYSDHAF